MPKKKMCTYTCAQTHTHTRTNDSLWIHTLYSVYWQHIHTHAHTHTYTHTQTYTHTHTEEPVYSMYNSSSVYLFQDQPLKISCGYGVRWNSTVIFILYTWKTIIPIIPIDFKGSGYIFCGDNSVRKFLPPFWKVVYSKRKEFALKESKFFPFRADPRKANKTSQKVVSFVKMAANSPTLNRSIKLYQDFQNIWTKCASVMLSFWGFLFWLPS